MKIRIVILYRLKIISDFNLRIQLFFDLADKCLLRCFSWFDLAARELPAVFEISLAALGGKNMFVMYDNCCNYSYCFHGYISFSSSSVISMPTF